MVVGFPATPLLTTRMRVCISAAHSRADLDYALEVFKTLRDRWAATLSCAVAVWLLGGYKRPSGDIKSVSHQSGISATTVLAMPLACAHGLTTFAPNPILACWPSVRRHHLHYCDAETASRHIKAFEAHTNLISA